MRNILLIIVSLFFARTGYATTWGSDCSYETATVNVSFPSGIKVTIDPNAPNGTVFYEYYIPSRFGANFKCQTRGAYTRQQGYIYGSGGQTTTMSGGGLSSQTGSGYLVYKTNVPGIGLVVREANYALPYWWSTTSVSNSVLDFSEFKIMNFDIDIVKYGDIPIGTRTINLDSTVISSIDWIVRISNSSNTDYLPNGDVPLYRFVLTPVTVDIVTGTCDTPDVSVNLGKRQLGDTSNQQGGIFVTPWVDASIRLVNCPIFYGSGQRSDYMNEKDSTRANVMTVTLIPNNVTTSTEGIMPVDTVALAAEGVGIQLAYGTSASPEFVDFSSGQGTKTYTMSETQGTAYTIPLVARYMQTASSISEINAGKANGKITYLIDYY